MIAPPLPPLYREPRARVEVCLDYAGALGQKSNAKKGKETRPPRRATLLKDNGAFESHPPRCTRGLLGQWLPTRQEGEEGKNAPRSGAVAAVGGARQERSFAHARCAFSRSGNY